MALRNMTTNLKSLRFGKDRIGGGSSKEPFNTNSINGTPGDTGGPDFLLRANTLQRTGEDLSRIGQFMISPKGLQFAAKQNVLSRTAIKLQRSTGETDIFGNANSFNPINEGIYLPTSTLAQIAVNSSGGHLLKQGINPFRNTDAEGSSTGVKFIDNILNNGLPLSLPLYIREVTNDQTQSENRLVQLAESKIGIARSSGNNPVDSFLGSLFEDRIVDNLPVRPTFGEVAGGIFNNLLKPPSNDGLNISPNDNEILRYNGGPGSALGLGQTALGRYIDTQAYDTENFKKNYYLSSYSLLVGARSQDTVGSHNTLQDFREPLLSLQEQGNRKNVLSKSVSYTGNETLGTRVNMLDPGRRGRNLTSYVTGSGEALDKINALPLYQKPTMINDTKVINDLVKFRIGILDNNKDGGYKTYIHFRSFINSFSDTYSADWNAEKFMGRGESFYRYGGFDRDIQMSWTVAALSKAELIPQYQKLNFLASSLAPNYSDEGYMQGNLAYLTMGGYCYEQPGFITNLSITPPQEAPFEVNLGDSDPQSSKSASRVAKELPMYVDVDISFKPIHNFVPKVQTNVYNGLTTEGGGGNYVSSFGQERFIALKNAANNQYASNNFVRPKAGSEQENSETPTGSIADEAVGTNVGFDSFSFGREGLY